MGLVVDDNTGALTPPLLLPLLPLAPFVAATAGRVMGSFVDGRGKNVADAGADADDGDGCENSDDSSREPHPRACGGGAPCHFR